MGPALFGKIEPFFGKLGPSKWVPGRLGPEKIRVQQIGPQQIGPRKNLDVANWATTKIFVNPCFSDFGPIFFQSETFIDKVVLVTRYTLLHRIPNENEETAH